MRVRPYPTRFAAHSHAPKRGRCLVSETLIPIQVQRGGFIGCKCTIQPRAPSRFARPREYVREQRSQGLLQKDEVIDDQSRVSVTILLGLPFCCNRPCCFKSCVLCMLARLQGGSQVLFGEMSHESTQYPRVTSSASSASCLAFSISVVQPKLTSVDWCRSAG